MRFGILIFVIGFVYVFDFCDANAHGFGKHLEFGLGKTYRWNICIGRRIWFGTKDKHLAYSRNLIDDKNKVATDYTIIYKYLGARYKRIAYLEFDINVESEGTVNATDKNSIEAKIHIKNAVNVTAILRIYIINPNFETLPDDVRDIMLMMGKRVSRAASVHDYSTKSITFIHKKKSNPLKVRPVAQNAMGRRRQGDSLLHFESCNVTNMSRFPSRAFEYSGQDYITYVGFSFNSPTAMALINTSFVGEQEFNAVAYDMNTEHFVANMSVYGIRYAGRPSRFEGVI